MTLPDELTPTEHGLLKTALKMKLRNVYLVPMARRWQAKGVAV